MIAAVIVGVMAVLVVVAYLSYRANQKRKAAFQAWATAHGFGYAERDDRYRDMPWGSPFGTGSGRAAFDVVTGSWRERPAVCFTYRYQTEHTDTEGHRTTDNHWFAVHALTLPKALPTLRVSREGFLSGIARAVGMHDIEFESEDFNKTFKVKGDDRKFASDIVHPRLMAMLLDTDAPGFTIVGSDLVLVRNGRLRPEAVESSLTYLDSVAGSIPDFVWDGR